jgi:hypothetical protein
MSLIARLLLVGTQRTGSAFQKVVWKDNDRHQPHDDDSSTANLANREPGSTTVFAAATIVKRPLAGAMISCRASSIRISAIGSPAATIDPSAMNHRSTIPSGNILDAQSASSTLIPHSPDEASFHFDFGAIQL